MGYVTLPECRLFTGLTLTDISNEDLQTFINMAGTIIAGDLTIDVKDEEAVGDINGTNSTFKVSNYPIADTNTDSVVNSSDLTVYSWSDASNPATKSTVAVTTVYPREGYIVLTTAPVASIAKVTVDYAFTYEDALSWDMIKLACSYMTAYLYCIKKFTVLPTTVSRGPLRFQYAAKPYDEYYKKYQDIMASVKTQMHVKKTSVDMVLKRTRMRQ